MKIISKYKDYYDYVVGEYGLDKTIVYDRRIMDMFKFDYPSTDGYSIYTFHICNEKFDMYEYQGKFAVSYKEIDKLNLLLKKNNESEISKHYRFFDDQIFKSTTKNIEYRTPILLEKMGSFYIPLCKTFDMHKVFNAKEMFEKVYTFISWLKDNPEIPNNQTDLEKIISHGFDKKSSFRH